MNGDAGFVQQPLGRLPLADVRAVGGPVTLPLLACYVAFALLGWLAAAVALIAAAPDLASGRPMAATPLLAAHLVALGFLPLAVSAAAFHLLPVMLRNGLHSERRLWVALPLLVGGGWLLAPGIAFGVGAAVWPGAALLTVGLALIGVELAGLVVHAPRGRLLVASRIGVALSLFHVAAALALGALVFAHGDAPVLGLSHTRWLLIHLHIALLGWLALLIVTVGRTLGPMRALAPAAPARRVPAEELTLTLGLWLLGGGIAADRRLAFVGATLVLAALARFGALLTHVARRRRVELEGPLAHFLAGAVFLLQAAVLGFALLAGAVSQRHGLAAYVLLLLIGWAAGVTLGHLPKLLSLSIWVWWPPGPRPKQAALYPRRLAQAEAAVFALGVETLAASVYFGSVAAARTGAALLAAAALLVTATAASSWARRSRT